MRLFLAIKFSSKATDKLLSLQNTLRHSIRQELNKISWTEEKNFHITLKFIGEYASANLDILNKTVERIVNKSQKIKLSLNGFNTFPDLKRVKIINLKFTDTTGNMQLLHTSLDLNLQQLGIMRESKPFVPHLTIGRVKFSFSMEALPEIKKEQYFEEGIDQILLIESKLNRLCAEYTVLTKFNLP